MNDNRLSEERAAHTPGPWWIHREYSTMYIEGKARDERVVQEVAAVGPKEGGSEQQAADARLIAAAPELLEALRGLHADVRLNNLDHENSHWMTRAHRAIAKATGAA